MPNEIGAFLREVLARPRQVSALAPSSRALARQMVAQVPDTARRVIELGPGTGIFTRALLARGIPPEGLSLYELSPNFAARLAGEFATLDIRNASAADIGREPAGSVDAVVSGLPLLSMPNEVVAEVVSGAFAALRPGAPYIQFTYGPLPPIPEKLREALGLTFTRSRRVWANLPPATVYTFRSAAR